MIHFYSIWTTNKNTVVSHRKENYIENGKQRIFFPISYFNLVHLITMHYYMRFGKDNMNTFSFLCQFFGSPEIWIKIPVTSQ